MAAHTVVKTSQPPPSNSDIEQQFPQSLHPEITASYGKLSPAQAGHLRHFHNLVSQPDGEWKHMGSQDPGQEWLDSYRYQLAMMAYAAGAAHFHRLPGLRSIFRELLDKIIAKMLRREVWGYWYLTSQSGTFVDPDLTDLRKPWPDPVRKENIMYSGHLLLMISLYSMLFNSDKYDQESALQFNWDPVFWGFGPEKHTYNLSSLQAAILDEMRKQNWLGVCCEPNCVFVVCNQFPIIAMHLNDIHQGTNVAKDGLQKYKAAWKEKSGMVQEDGLLCDWYLVRQDTKVPGKTIAFTAWANAFMHSWNPVDVERAYPSQSLGFLTRVSENRVNVNRTSVAHDIRTLVRETGVDPNSPTTVRQAQAISEETERFERTPPFRKPEFGYIVQWISKIGDEATLEGLLNQADLFLKPTWELGGLYYPRNDQISDGDGNWTMVDPFTGNTGIAYSRLNVPNGQRIMWQKPWTPEDVSHYPFVDGVDLSSGIDFLRGVWDDEKGAMVVTLRSWDWSVRKVNLVFRNLPGGSYGIYKNNQLSERTSVSESKATIELGLEIAGNELDIVLLRH